MHLQSILDRRQSSLRMHNLNQTALPQKQGSPHIGNPPSLARDPLPYSLKVSPHLARQPPRRIPQDGQQQ